MKIHRKTITCSGVDSIHCERAYRITNLLGIVNADHEDGWYVIIISDKRRSTGLGWISLSIESLRHETHTLTDVCSGSFNICPMGLSSSLSSSKFPSQAFWSACHPASSESSRGDRPAIEWSGPFIDAVWSLAGANSSEGREAGGGEGETMTGAGVTEGSGVPWLLGDGGGEGEPSVKELANAGAQGSGELGRLENGLAKGLSSSTLRPGRRRSSKLSIRVEVKINLIVY